jgi:hypothetical protein
MRFFGRIAEPARDDPRTLLVEAGRVTCPRRGEADIEECFVCGWMTESHMDAREPSLRCAARVPRAYADRTAFAR